MSDTDSFIDEVNEEVRRDRFYFMLKRYGWIAVLAVILLYVVLDAPDPRHFGIATYLLYAAFTSVLVAESMRHTVPPTSDSE